MTLLAVTILGIEIGWAAPAIDRAATHVSHIHVGWLLLALVCEWISLVAFARLQRVLLAASGVRVKLRSVIATVLAGNALSITLPGGSAVSAIYTTRRFRAFGVRPSLVATSLVITGLLSSLALAGIAAGASALAGDTGRLGHDALQLSAIVVLCVLVVIALRRPRVVRWLVEPVLRGWLRLRPKSGARRHVDTVLAELTTVRPSTWVWTRGFGFALVNWTADLCCLLLACSAVGAHPSFATVVLAYALAMAAASALPILPGGLGVVDAALILALHSGGVSAAAATAADLVYRSISLGLLVIAGWCVYAVQRHRTARAARANGHEAVAIVAEGSPELI
jgi:hypothetical protein